VFAKNTNTSFGRGEGLILVWNAPCYATDLREP